MERRPAAQGLLWPLNLMARCRSTMLDPSLNVASHRDLVTVRRGGYGEAERKEKRGGEGRGHRTLLRPGFSS